jgi:hypothetical protein
MKERHHVDVSIAIVNLPQVWHFFDDAEDPEGAVFERHQSSQRFPSGGMCSLPFNFDKEFQLLIKEDVTFLE